MKYITNLFFITALFTYATYAAEIKGTVVSSGKPVEFANVFVKGTQTGATANSNGKYAISNIAPGTYYLLATAIGYKSDSIKVVLKENEEKTINFNLKESENNLNEVVITGTMKEVAVSESPIHIDIISPKLFSKNPTPNIFESLNMVNGVRPQLQCNVCNTGDIHINGMEGPYTMVMIDGMPIVSALGTVYGLMGIPNSIIQRIEVQKGPASTLYGSEAVGGLINVITKSANTAPLFSIDIFGTSYGEINTDISAKIAIGKKITALFSTNYFHFDKLWDKNNDNFTDVTLQKRIAGFSKFTYEHNSKKLSHLALRYYYEDRWGGELQWDLPYRGGDSIYGESIFTNRFELIGMSPLHLFNSDFTLQYSFNRHQQNSAYGNTLFNADQNILFAQLLKNVHVKKHDLLFGLPFRRTFYDDNTVITQTGDSMNINNKPSLTKLAGAFVQDEIRINDLHSVLLGIRADYNCCHKKVIVSPRINYKWIVNEHNTLRFGVGNGYRVVNLFSEDHAAYNGAREVVILNNLKPEQCWSTNTNYTLYKNLKKGFLSVDINLFYTYFSNKIVADYFSDPNKIIFDNLKGYGINRGAGAQLHYEFLFPMKISAGLTYVDVYLMKENNTGTSIKTAQVQTPPLTSNFVVSYKFEKIKTALDLSGNIYSPMLLPVLPNDYRPDYSPWFCLMNIQSTTELNLKWQIYIGIKNLLNYFPKEDPIMRPFDPFDQHVNDPVNNPKNYTFDPGYNYAPLQGIRGFLGIRYKL